MKACADWREPLTDHALGQPAGPELAEHLAECAACTRALAELRSQVQQLETEVRRLVAVEPSPQLSSRLFAAIQASSSQATWIAQWKPALVVLAVLVAIGAGVYVVQGALEKQERKILVGVAALSQWRSPTEVLLQSPGQALLRSTPRLGEAFFPLPSLTGKSEPEKRFTPKGGNNAS